MGFVAATLLVAVTSQNADSKIRNTFSENDVGSAARIWYWEGTFRMIREHPLAGGGLGPLAQVVAPAARRRAGSRRAAEQQRVRRAQKNRR